MGIALALLSLWTGSAKAVSVCGVNGALAARPTGGVSAPAILGYFLGLYLGSLLLVSGVAAIGSLIAAIVPISTDHRLLIAGVGLLALGLAEALAGDTILPHIAWAVPRRWVPWRFGLAFFGLIRGVAIFNHSPFASMHAWLVVLLLFPGDLGLLTMAALIAIGLAAWSIVDGVASLLLPRDDASLLERLSTRLLIHRRRVAVADGFALVAVGSVLMLLGLGGVSSHG